MLRRTAVVVIASILVLVAACSSDPKPDPKPPADTKPTATASATGDAVAPGTQKSAQKLLDGARDQLVNDASGEFASYVNFGGSAIKIVGRFDLADLELETETRFSPTTEGGKSVGLKSRVVGTQIFAGPSFGPYAKCWFHYATGSIDKLLPGDLPFDEELAAIPLGLVIAADAKAIGSIRSNTFDIRANVSAQSALVALSSQFASQVFDKLPAKNLQTVASITVRNGTYTSVTIRARDVVDAYDRKGIDLFEKAPDGFKETFVSATLTTEFRKYATDVSVSTPPTESLVEVSGPDDVEGNPLCAAVAS